MIETAGLLGRFELALERAAGWAVRGEVVVSATAELELGDVCAAVFASRLATDDWFCWSEPERGFELAGLGAAARITERGAERFSRVARACAELTESAEILGPGDRAGISGLPAGAGPVWIGGFAFDPEGGGAASWSSFAPAEMVLPELSLNRQGERVLATLNAVIGPGVGAERALYEAGSRLAGLRESALALLDPHPAAPAKISSRLGPGHFQSAVGQAVERLREPGAGVNKVVLAREIQVRAQSAHDSGAIFGALREGFPSCFVFCRGTREGAFLGASPELLVRRSGASAVTVALAGSARRSSDPALDDHLGEQLLRSEKDRHEHEIVARRIVRALRPHSVWVEAAPEPGLAKVANIQHLATPIVAQLADSRSAIELAGLLHPTPAVGGEPWPRAAALVEQLEDLDRGWYAGPVGWMDSTGDGEFCVALRSALLRDRDAHLYAGVGVVAASDPAAELAETELKLSALLSLLAD